MATEEVKKIQKSGNSFYVTIPRSYLTHLGLTRKDFVVVRLFRDYIVLSPYKTHHSQGGKKCPEK